MDEFENAVESGTLPKFLKQDQEATREGEGELERLMRDMTDSDLDKLAGEIGEGEGSGREVGKVGSVPGGPEAKEVVQEKKMGDPHLRLSDIGASKEEVGEALRSAGTVDGLIAAFEKVEAKEKVD